MATYNITVLSTSSTSNGWRFSGMDKNGAINSNVANPEINVNDGDAISFTYQQSSSHPFDLYHSNECIEAINDPYGNKQTDCDNNEKHIDANLPLSTMSFGITSPVPSSWGTNNTASFPYSCSNHPGSMNGIIKMGEATTTAAPTTAAPTTAAPTTAAPTTAAPTTAAPTTIAPPPPLQVNNCFTQFDTIKFKRGYFWEFWLENPVLKAGEPSYTMDACAAYLKIGDGTTKWRQLPCFKLECGGGCEIPTTIPPVPPPPDGKDCNPMLCVIFLDESDAPAYSRGVSFSLNEPQSLRVFIDSDGTKRSEDTGLQRGDDIVLNLPLNTAEIDLGLTPCGYHWRVPRMRNGGSASQFFSPFSSRVFIQPDMFDPGTKRELHETDFGQTQQNWEWGQLTDRDTLTLRNGIHLNNGNPGKIFVERIGPSFERAGKEMALSLQQMLTAFPNRLLFSLMGPPSATQILEQYLYISTYADPKYVSGDTQRYFCIPTETLEAWSTQKDLPVTTCIDENANPIPCVNSCLLNMDELRSRCVAYWSDKAHLWNIAVHGALAFRTTNGALSGGYYDNIRFTTSSEIADMGVCLNDTNADMIERGGMWKAMKEVINTKAQSIQDLFYKSTQMAIFVDNSGSTYAWQVELMRNDLVMQAAADGVKTVQAINNGNEHIFCPFCQVECCESLTSEAQLEAYNKFRELCLIGTSVGSYPSCDSTPAPTTTEEPVATTQPPTFTACLGVVASQNIIINGNTHSVSYAWNQTTERYTATLYLMGTSTLTLTMRCDSSNTSVEPDGWSTRWTASVATNITNGSASVVRYADQSSRGTQNDIPIWDITFNAAGISERPSSGPNNYDCVYNLDINLNTNQLRWSEQSTSGDDCVSNEDCTDENDIESLGYTHENGLIDILRLPCPCSCPSDTDVYHTLIYKDPTGDENCYDSSVSGFNTYNATFIYFKTEGDIKYYVATRYFLEVDQENSISIPVPIPQLQLIMTCDCSKNGHARWGLTAEAFMSDGNASVTNNIRSLGTDTTPPEWEVNFTHVDTQCMDLCCGYELQRDNISQAWKWGVTLDSNMFTTDQENDETLCWDMSDAQDRANLYNRFPPSSGIINHSAHANASWISGGTGQKGFLMINCTDCGCNEGLKPSIPGDSVDDFEEVGCGNKAIIEPTMASNNAMCFGTCVYTWDGTEWIKTFEDCDNGAP